MTAIRPPHPALTPTVRGHFETDRYVFFWSGPFSNWDNSGFEYDGIKFSCSEQAMMYYKAKLFNAEDIAAKVMKTRDARKQKALGRSIPNFDRQLWLDKAVEVMTPILAAKFDQYPGYRDILLDTGDKMIVEASPFDEVWGIKMGVNHPDILDESKWQGTNLLGICLMNARDLLRANK